MLKNLFKYLAVIATLGWAAGTQAMPIITPVGVWGLEVDNVLYDVAIGDQDGKTVGEVYANYGLTTDRSLLLASVSRALRDALSKAKIEYDFFHGCEVSDYAGCIIFLPTYTTADKQVLRGSSPTANEVFAQWTTSSSRYSVGLRLESDDIRTFGIVSVSPSTISISSTLILLISALICGGWMGRQAQHST